MLIGKNIVFICACLFVINVSFAQTSLNMELLDRWHQDSLINNTSEVRYSDCYGFVWNGKEYAVAGSTEGTHVFEITADNTFVPKGFVRGRFSNTSVSHRDYAIYQHYLYAVCDEGVSSLQIIDFQYLPDSIHLAAEDTTLFGRVHNIFIDTAQAKFYSCIHRSTSNTQIIEAPMKIFSLADPLQLTELWSGPGDVIEVHDCYVRNGKAILNCGFDGLRVYDFTNTVSPDYLDSKTFYQDQGYNHQGWLTPDGKTYIFADETNGKQVKKCSFNGSAITITNLFGFNHLNGSVPHNIMANDTFAFVAYYNEGLRVFDLRYSPPLQVAHYDTYPEENFFKMNGNWGIYSNLPSKRILAMDRQYGLFLLHFDQQAFLAVPNEEVSLVYPNPLSEDGQLTVRLPNPVTAFEWELADEAGKIVFSGSLQDQNYLQLEPLIASGIYFLRLKYRDYLDDEKQEILRVVQL
ncbi:MAG: choice-of-anchor B family protein [Bacteroidota bacterium]